MRENCILKGIRIVHCVNNFRIQHQIYYTAITSIHFLNISVHLSPHAVVTSQAYKTWMESFTPSTIHIMSGRGICLQQSSFIAATRQNMKHRLLCPDFFSSMTIESYTDAVPVPVPVCDADGFCRLHLNVSGEGITSESTVEAVAGSTVSVISGKNRPGLTGLIDPDSISTQGTSHESSVSAASDGRVSGAVCVIRGAALMRYDMLPARRRGLVPHDPLKVLGVDVTRDQGPAVTSAAVAVITGNTLVTQTSATAVSEVEATVSEAPSKSMVIASSNEPENPVVCTPTDPELIEFWSRVGDNSVIRDSLCYAAKVRRKAGVDRDLSLESQYVSSSSYSNGNTPSSSSSSSSSSDNGSRSIGSSSRALGSFGYPTVADIGITDDIQNLGNMKLEKRKPQYDLDVDDGPEYTKTFEAAERDLVEENRDAIELERMELHYDFTQYQADLLKLAGTLGGSIVFLGTACAIPSKYRNVSGILLTLPTPAASTIESGDERTHRSMGQATMLLDAGEGTWQQLVRMAHHTPALLAPNSVSADAREGQIKTNTNTGTETDIETGTEQTAVSGLSPLLSVEETLAKNLKVIWISHPHADHHLGLLMILSERKRLLTQRAESVRDRERGREGPVRVSEDVEFSPLLLIAPPSVLAFLRDYCLLDKGGLVRGSYIPVSSRQFDKRDSCANGDTFWCDVEDNSQSNLSHFDSDGSGIIECKVEGEIVREGVEVVVNKFGYSYEKPRSPSKSSEGLNGASVRPLNPYQTEWQPNWQIAAKRSYFLARKILQDVGIDEIENVKVIHCPQAYGAVITFSVCTQDLDSKEKSDPGSSQIPHNSLKSNQKLKIVYSGDTRPSKLLSEIGRDCALLIHEATFEDDETGVLKSVLGLSCMPCVSRDVDNDHHYSPYCHAVMASTPMTA
jgi:ribonuclease BN (tRNA processing enzyme)